MPQLDLIDTFPEFLTYWKKAQDQSMAVQVESWAEQYMNHWPELRQKQIDCYTEDGEDWRAIAREHIFPFLSVNLPAMAIAHDNFGTVTETIYHRCRQFLDFNGDIVCILYVGIGCGAGWATRYEGKPAILFGLENIAAEKWQDQETLSGLMAHELGHLAHFHWRDQAGLTHNENPWWQLYTEGFAQWCEHLIMGKDSWHMKTAVGEQWQVWGQDNLSWLAAEFLRRVDNDEDIRPFFGSWFELQGYKQTGYFLGHELLKRMRVQSGLHEIALIEDVESQLRPLLTQLADSNKKP